MAKDGAETPVVTMSVPTAIMGPNGTPLTVIGAQASELVGLPKFSNVTIGPFVAYRWVEARDDADLERELLDLAGVINGAITHQREIVLEAVKAFARSGKYGDVRNETGG